VDALQNLGSVQMHLGKPTDAIAAYSQALRAKPDFAYAHTGLGNALTEAGQLDLAVQSHRRAIAIDPEFAEAHNNLGNTLAFLGRLDEAIASYRRALAIKPDFAQAYTGLFFALSHDDATDAKTLFAEHLRFGRQFDVTPDRQVAHGNVRDPDRAIRVGVVSADLRNHAVARFFEPLLAHLAGSRGLSLHAYYNYAFEDDHTPRLRCYFKDWNPVARLSDSELAQRIRNDAIDVLIDLSGHTAGNRLLTFAQKPAPVQASWMGYPGTTGLRSMDYYIADRHFLPMLADFGATLSARQDAAA